MKNTNEKYVHIFATSFLIEDRRRAIEYRLTMTESGCRLDRRIHGGAGIGDILVDWGAASYYSDLKTAIGETFQRLRSMEINNGLYRDLCDSCLPIDIYAPKIDQWVDYVVRLGFTHFTIQGNESKYLPIPSPETKAFSLRLYESLIDQFQTPSSTDLWLEELIKREISKHNEAHFARNGVEEMAFPAFLKRYYPDFDDQIDRYLLHQKVEDRVIRVTPRNRQQLIEKFEHYLLPEFEH